MKSNKQLDEMQESRLLKIRLWKEAILEVPQSALLRISESQAASNNMRIRLSVPEIRLFGQNARMIKTRLLLRANYPRTTSKTRQTQL